MTEVRYNRPIWAGRIPRQKIAELYLSGPGARDLIGGKPKEIIDFLNNLSYGAKSSPEILSTRQEWLDKAKTSREQYASAATERNRKKAKKTERVRLKKKVREEMLARRRDSSE